MGVGARGDRGEQAIAFCGEGLEAGFIFDQGSAEAVVFFGDGGAAANGAGGGGEHEEGEEGEEGDAGEESGKWVGGVRGVHGGGLYYECRGGVVAAYRRDGEGEETRLL